MFLSRFQYPTVGVIIKNMQLSQLKLNLQKTSRWYSLPPSTRFRFLAVAQVQPLNKRLIPCQVLAAQVGQQSAAATDHLEQPASG